MIVSLEEVKARPFFYAKKTDHVTFERHALSYMLMLAKSIQDSTMHGTEKRQ